MARNDLRDALRGVTAGLLTPFDDDLEIAHDELRSNARTLYDRGLRTFLAAANISEYHSLSHEERIAVTRTSVEALPSDATVLGGVGGSTKTAIDLIASYEDDGVDAIMVMPPTHTYLHERGLLTYYRRLADAATTPLVPYVRDFHPSVDFLVELSEVEGVGAIKYALEDVPTFVGAVDRGSPDVVWVDGLAEPYAPALFAAGAEGFTAGVSNFAPRIGLSLFDALEAGDRERARRITAVTEPFQRFRGESGQDNVFPAANSVPAVKHALDRAGMYGGPVREPLAELSAADRQRVDQLYDTIRSFETSVEN